MSEQVKSCPFCGKMPNVVAVPTRQNDNQYMVKCDEYTCMVNPYSHSSVGRDDAIERWNFRAPGEKDAGAS